VIQLFPSLYMSKTLNPSLFMFTSSAYSLMVFIMQLGSIVFTVNHLFVRSMYTADERSQSQTLGLHSQGRMSGSLKQFHCLARMWITTVTHLR